MGFRDAAHPVMQWDVEREIQIVWGWGAAGLNLKRIGAEGLKGFGISPEETEGNAILAAAEILGPSWW